MGIMDRIAGRCVAGTWITLATVAILCVSCQAGFMPAASPSSAPRIPQAAPTPSYFPPSWSRCSPGIAGAPYEWQAIVCPAADQLTTARHSFDILVRDGDRKDWIAVYSDAALLSQQLSALQLSVEHAPGWKRGAGVLAAITAAIGSYRDGVEALNDAARFYDVQRVKDGKKLIAAGHKSFASAVHGLKALATPAPSGSPAPAASAPPSGSPAPRASAKASAAP